LIGLERGQELLRTGRPVRAKQACAWGWAHGEPAGGVIEVAKALVRQHLEGKVELKPVDPAPLGVPGALPRVDLGHHSLAIDRALVAVVRRGLSRPLREGLDAEADGFAACQETVDYDIGMTNFIVNGPRVPASFLNE